MKFYKNPSKNLFWTICAMLIISVTLFSCVKDTNSNYIPPAALVTLIQASPDQPPLDFFLDNNKVNSNGPVVYGNSIDYFKAYAAKRTATFYNTGTTNKVFSDTITLKANYVYSLFLANKSTSPELFLLTDSISQPSGTNASIRFVNMSPDAPAVDLAIKGGNVVVANKSYKGFSSFIQTQGNTNYTFEVRKAGTSTVLATLPTKNLNSNFVYTIWFYGLANPTNSTDGLTVGIVTNAYY